MLYTKNNSCTLDSLVVGDTIHYKKITYKDLLDKYEIIEKLDIETSSPELIYIIASGTVTEIEVSKSGKTLTIYVNKGCFTKGLRTSLLFRNFI